MGGLIPCDPESGKVLKRELHWHRPRIGMIFFVSLQVRIFVTAPQKDGKQKQRQLSRGEAKAPEQGTNGGEGSDHKGRQGWEKAARAAKAAIMQETKQQGRRQQGQRRQRS